MAGLLLSAVVSDAQSQASIAPAPAVQPGEVKAGPPAVGGAHTLEPGDLEAFFDGVVPLQLERGDIAGASVLVMQDGKVLLAKGYGYADVKAKKAVDPSTSMFRLASISKLFTWVAVMQLEEQGKLDLDTDVNRYLDFQIEPAFNKPITLRNLMTHTGGFEEETNETIIIDPKLAVPLRDYMIANQPKRLFPPGEVPAYSNYGAGLASYIVQRISGEPFEQYVAEHIFAPLGMTHSSFHQPPEQPLATLPSEGYRESTLKPAVGFEIFNPVGAGGISSTAADMGRFGQALLSGGELDGKRILKAETVARMWTPQFQANSQMPPACMGFYEDWRNNLHWIGHEGDLIAFHSMFFVEPQQKLVLFVSYNSASSENRPRPEIVDFFTDRYFPAKPNQVFVKAAAGDMKSLEGGYEPTRRADSTKLKLSSLFDQDHASVDDDGVLNVDGFLDLRGHPVKWKPIGKDLWQAVDGQQRMFFIRDSSNRVVRVAIDFPGEQFQRVPWYEDSVFVICVVGAGLQCLWLVVLATLLRVGRRIFLRKRPPVEPQPGTLRLTWGPRLAAFAWVILFSTVSAVLRSRGASSLPPTPAWFGWLTLLNFATAAAIGLSMFAAFSAVRVWSQHAAGQPDLGQHVRWISKVKFTLVGVACLILCWFAIHWNLIGPAHRI
jgi:CubicO group peptidase (beta-lactamase class C family)